MIEAVTPRVQDFAEVRRGLKRALKSLDDARVRDFRCGGVILSNTERTRVAVAQGAIGMALATLEERGEQWATD